MSELADIIDCHEDLIRLVPLFADLGDEEARQLWESAERLHAAPGDLIITEGDRGDSMYIVLSGMLEVTKRDGDREVVLAARKPGEFIGEMSLLEEAPRTASVRALSTSELLLIGADRFRRLIESRPSIATTVLRTVAGRLRSTEASLIQSDKLASLGTLAAGLAHELNNPAAAIQRSATYLSEAFATFRQRTAALNALDLGAEERRQLLALEAADAAPVDGAAARREESRLASRLEDIGVDDPWEVAPALAAHGWTLARLEPLAATFAPAHLNAVLQWLGAGLAAEELIGEIQRSGEAISGIVRGVKSYAYLDQAPVQNVDIALSLEDTLMILNHKLKSGIEVVRDFEPDLPRVEAHGGELNQVWTNIVDNAIQAMDGKGTLELGARRIGESVEVRIADSGPGIPPDVGARIFDPFFTTKPQGVGTGLGLHIARNIIVNQHRGRLDFDSRPGRTEFRIVLPLTLAPAATSPR